jgi:hypothetical protein
MPSFQGCEIINALEPERAPVLIVKGRLVVHVQGVDWFYNLLEIRTTC